MYRIKGVQFNHYNTEISLNENKFELGKIMQKGDNC